MGEAQEFGRFQDEQQARDEAAMGGYFGRSAPDDKVEAIIDGLVAGIHQAQAAYDERHGIGRDADGRIVSRRPLDEVIREKGPRREVSMYETPGFVSWQVSKRSARARWLEEQVEEVERTAVAAGMADSDRAVLRVCAERARAAAGVARQAWEEAHAIQARAHREDEYAYQRVLALHGLAAEAVSSAEMALARALKVEIPPVSRADTGG